MKSVVALLLVALVAAASAETIVEVLAQEPLYSQVYQSLADKPIEEFLNASTTVATLLAPINQATPLNLTNADISYHVLNGIKLNSSDIVSGELFVTALNLTSLSGAYQRIKATVVNGTTVLLGPNQVVLNHTELEASNGAIYGVQSPIAKPVDINSLAASTVDLSTLSTVLKSADVVLNDSVPAITVFAPNDTAFATLSQSKPLVFSYLTSSYGKEDLQNLLKLHVVATGILYSSDITGSKNVTTLSGEDILVTRDQNGVTISNANGAAKVVATDELASNGVAHVIDQVLVPTTFKFNLGKALIGLNLTKFEEALRSYNLTQYLDNTAPFTLFAPTNAALVGKTTTAELCKFHIIEGSKTSFNTSLVQSQLALPSANSAFQQLKVVVDANTTTVEGYTLSAPQLVEGYGVIYVIDTVFVPPSKTIVQAAASSFSKLASALELAGVTSGVTNTTVFAPVNGAFVGPVAEYLLLNTTQSNIDLANVLKAHVVAGSKYYYANGEPALPIDTEIETLNSAQNVTVTITNGTVFIDKASKVVEADILASDGVIHAIDSVIFPEDFEINNDKVVQGFKATNFLSLLTKFNLSEVLSDGTFTIFAFTDAAYDSAPQELVDDPSKWPTVLKTHIYNGSISALEAGRNYTMLSGEVLQAIDSHTVQIKGSENAGQPKVLGGPIVTANGVVYSIDGILTIKATTKDDSGLSDTAIGFIVIGCIVGVLLIIGAAGGGYWYYRRRVGYENIGDGAY